MYRRPLPTTNLSFLSAVMWDGRASVPGRAIGDDLVAQAVDATVRHAQGTAPSSAQLREIVDFELGLVTAQVRDHAAGSLRAGGARGGPGALARQPFCIGIIDPLGMRPSMPGACLATSRQLDPVVFTLFGAWAGAASDERQAIARGEAIFNTRQFEIDNVPGLNGHPSDPVSGPIRAGTCTVCHDTPNAGNHSVAMALNIGIAAASRRTADLPLYTLRHKWTGDVVQTSDPGRAMVTGTWKDIGKFKGPILRALAARPHARMTAPPPRWAMSSRSTTRAFVSALGAGKGRSPRVSACALVSEGFAPRTQHALSLAASPARSARGSARCLLACRPQDAISAASGQRDRCADWP